MEKDKEFSKWLERELKEIGAEKPSINFTASVLDTLQNEAVLNAYVPLISKKVWWTIAVFVLGVCVYLSCSAEKIDEHWMSIDNLDFLTKFNLTDSMPSIQVSNTFVYAFLSLALFFYVQIFLLRQHFNKQVP